MATVGCIGAGRVGHVGAALRCLGVAGAGLVAGGGGVVLWGGVGGAAGGHLSGGL